VTKIRTRESSPKVESDGQSRLNRSTHLRREGQKKAEQTRTVFDGNERRRFTRCSGKQPLLKVLLYLRKKKKKRKEDIGTSLEKSF